VAQVWNELERIIALASSEDDGVTLSFLSYRTMAYLFVTHSLECTRLMALVCLAVVLLLTASALRNRRAVLVVGLLVTTSGVAWFGLLQLLKIHISIFLLFPLVFVICVGSDYVLHILCRLRAEGLGDATIDPATHTRTARWWIQPDWGSAGRAITLAAVTDAGVFCIFSMSGLLGTSRVMLAVALAVATVFACTVILLPVLLPPGKRAAEHQDQPATPDARGRKRPPPDAGRTAGESSPR